MSPTLAKVFPDDDYKFHLRFERGAPADFFAATARNSELLAERRRWLRANAESYAALLPSGEALLAEAVQSAQNWNGCALPVGAASPWEKCLALGEFWEADFLLLKANADADGEVRLFGGCVCFPSSWRLSEKIGKPMEFIHEVVPGLNASLGGSIQRFLNGLKPGLAWLRSNWGLSRSPELNQHPDRSLPRLDATVGDEEVWLRVEHQALVALPASGGVLFGIRIETQSLAEVRADAELAQRLSRALQTLPEAMAVYKGLASARGRILEMLAC